MNTDTLSRTAPQQTAPTLSPADQAAIHPTAANAARSASEAIKKTAGEQVRQVTGDLREGGGEALESAKEAGANLVSRQKEKIAAKIDEYTAAVKAACESLKSDEKNPLAAPAESASQQLERAAQYLRSKEPMDILDDVGEFARKRPEIIYGAMFIAGLASVRFLKASSRDRDPRRNAVHTASGTTHLPYQTPSHFTP